MTTSLRHKDDRCITNLRGIARRLGYTLAVHGSRGLKDLDLIAIPWTEKAVSAVDLINAFVSDGKNIKNGEVITGKVNKPHGRIAHILVRFPFPGRTIDLSIMPRITP